MDDDDIQEKWAAAHGKYADDNKNENHHRVCFTAKRKQLKETEKLPMSFLTKVDLLLTFCCIEHNV